MKTVRFLLQRTNGLLEIEANVVANFCVAENRWNQGDPNYVGPFYETLALDLNEVQSADSMPFVAEAIPVGSVEFCNKAAELQGCKTLRAINVPDDLRQVCYLFRGAEDIQTYEQLKEHLSRFPSKIIKPADTAKRFAAVFYDGTEYTDSFLQQEEGPYYVTDMIQGDILSEWRVFFMNNRIIDIRPYLMYQWTVPTRKRIEDMLEHWVNGKPPAGTLDVAIVEQGGIVYTTILEAHPLIACGLYGFEDPDLLRMLEKAWLWHRRENAL